MVSLEYFLDNKLEDGSLLTDPNYEDYKVRSVKHEEREDGKYCIIIVE